MKIKEFAQLNKEELEKLLMEKHKALRDFRFELAQGKVKNVRAIRSAQKDIAKILTVISLMAKMSNSQI